MILEKIIRYEAVHRIRELGRSAPPHRSAGPALLRLLPSGADRRAADLRRGRADPRDSRTRSRRSSRCSATTRTPDKATTAVFYSISNCQRGLAGVSFGNFLIKQVVQEICRENPKLQTFVTLSPVPDFAQLARPRAQVGEFDRALGRRTAPRSPASTQQGWWQLAEAREPLREPLLRAAAWYFLRAKNRRGMPVGFGGALPSRQRRAAGAHQLARRRDREGHRPVLRR